MFTIALVVFVHVPVLFRSNVYILRADLKCAILETGRNTTFGALLESLGATNISGFVATALVSKLRTTERHGFRRDLTRFRIKNFAAAKNFRK